MAAYGNWRKQLSSLRCVADADSRAWGNLAAVKRQLAAGPLWLTGMRGGRAAWCRKGYLRAAAKLAGDIKPKLAGPERPVVREEADSRGLWDILIFSISDSWTRFDFARRFWNQILTWVSVRLRLFENSALSAIDRYCFSWNFFSSDVSCWVVNGVLGFRLGLCFLSAHLRGPKADCAGPPGPGKKRFF